MITFKRTGLALAVALAAAGPAADGQVVAAQAAGAGKTGTPAVAAGDAALGGVAGQESGLSLDEAVRLALASYPAIGAAGAGVDGAAAERREARSRWYPTVSVAGSATRFEEPMIVQPMHGLDLAQPPDFDRTLIQAEATIAYTLFDGGARSARVRQASADVGAATAELERTRAAVTAQVASAYLAVLSAGDVADAHGRRLEALREEERRVTALLDEGQAPELQLLRVQAALESARAEAVAARSALETAELELARLTGAAPARTTRARLTAVALRREEAPERDAAVELALASNPEVAAARQAVAAAGAGASAARGARWPTVDAFASYWERGGGDVAFDGEWGAGLKVSYPLFTGGAVRSRVDRAEAGERAARERLRLQELEAERQVDAALARAGEAEARAEALARAVERQEAVVRTERVALEVGAGVQTDFLAAQADLLEARAGLVGAEQARITARIELARLVGELDEEWIRANLELGR
jgi:outer membrane protein